MHIPRGSPAYYTSNFILPIEKQPPKTQSQGGRLWEVAIMRSDHRGSLNFESYKSVVRNFNVQFNTYQCRIFCHEAFLSRDKMLSFYCSCTVVSLFSLRLYVVTLKCNKVVIYQRLNRNTIENHQFLESGHGPTVAYKM